MSKVRDIAVLIAVVSAFAFSLAMFRSAVGVASPWFGLMIMLTCLGVIAFTRPLFLWRLPRFLREVRAWERKGTLYRALRVPEFGVLLRRTVLRSLNPLVYLSGHPDDAPVVIAQLESAEAAHYVAAAVLVPHMIYALIQGWLGALAWLMLAQIAGNLYPILHLRWARIRLGRLAYKLNQIPGRQR